MFKHKLTHLKDKLNDLSKRNRSIRLLKLYNKWNIDLLAFDRLNREGFAESILKKLSTKSSSSISLLKRDLVDDKVMNTFHALTTLYRNLRGIEEETGLYDLSIGYPFVSGRFLDGSYFRAPLFLFPIRLELQKTGGQQWILKREENEPQLNRSLLLAIKKLNEIDIDEVMFDEAAEVAGTGDISAVTSWLEKHHLKVRVTSQTLQSFPVYKTDECPDLPKGQLQIDLHAVLGSFPQGNTAILKDYEELMEKQEGDGLQLIHELLGLTNSLSGETNDYEWKDDQLPNVREENELFLMQTDGSQEEILREARYKKGMVVHGPPGTGKSQVIVNLIVDALFQGKKVMVVCQKRAALDVVYQRLDSLQLSSHAALIHDEKMDRAKVYAKVTNLIEAGSQTQHTKQDEFKQLSRKIEEREENLNKIARSLFEVQPNGFRAYDLYGLSRPFQGVHQFIPLQHVLSHLHKDNMDDMLAHVYNYAYYYQRFGRQDYPLKHRKSFSHLEVKNKVQLVEVLDDVIEKAKQTASHLHVFNDDSITPEYTWMIQDKLEKIYHDLDPSQKRTLQKLRLWWWTSFTGKTILNELLKGEKFKGITSKEWLSIRESLRTLYDIAGVADDISKKIESFQPYFVSDHIHSLKTGVAKGKIPVDDLEQKRQAIMEDFEELREMDRFFEEKTEEIRKLITVSVVHPAEKNGPVRPEETVEHLRQSLFAHWIDQVEKKNPHMVKVSTAEYSQLLESFRQLLDQKKMVGKKLLQADLLEGVRQANYQNQKQFKAIKHQASKRSQIWTLRKFVKEYTKDGLMKLFPVWLTSPEVVSSIFPLEPELFDLVIFDEASQCTVENSIPSIYRARQVLIAGDEKQLPPSNLFKVSSDGDGDADYDEEEVNGTFDDAESLLSQAKRIFSEKLLQWHYRSKSEELINFSNHAFYHGQIQIAPNVAPLSNPAAITWTKVEGKWINQSNETEAEKVVQLLKDQLIRHPNQSVGIITFNAKQQDKILDTIERQIENDPEFAVVYQQVMARDIDERIFVKNIENVQGDERDVIVFSIGYAPNEEGRIYNRFGLLNQAGGENRLNVAITRAKARIHVVTSIEPHELNVAGAKERGPKLFKAYLEYAQAVSQLDLDRIKKVLAEVGQESSTQKQHSNLVFDSPFEEQVYNQLKNLKYEVNTQVGLSGYRIDLAVVHPHDPTRYILGIECDGAMYHSSPSARERDIYRQKFLEDKGWTIARIWSRNWWKNPVQEMERIDQLIKELIKHEQAVMAVTEQTK
ncbi:AAA domain-containing protein [Brevibacillus dissolubilis]|uniref:AAA domain-containing protein n=1 Tax=Brevibacillus dissolubilis TaxID=1844116 RepID=UPI0011175A66|nr:AAA domain-containing protein [Brevibacillus dissolubilis]